MSDGSKKFETWGVLELFGRVKLAGFITEEVVGGIHFLRIDIPAIAAIPAHTRYFTSGAIYSMSPTSEEVARALASRLLTRTVQAYEIPRLSSSSHDPIDDSDVVEEADDDGTEY